MVVELPIELRGDLLVGGDTYMYRRPKPFGLAAVATPRTVDMAISIRALADHDVKLITVACSDWQELAQFGPPYWRPRSSAELRRKVAATAGPHPSTDYSFVLTDGDGLVVGECSLHAIDYRNGVAQIGVCIWNPVGIQPTAGTGTVTLLCST